MEEMEKELEALLEQHESNLTAFGKQRIEVLKEALMAFIDDEE